MGKGLSAKADQRHLAKRNGGYGQAAVDGGFPKSYDARCLAKLGDGISAVFFVEGMLVKNFFAYNYLHDTIKSENCQVLFMYYR